MTANDIEQIEETPRLLFTLDQAAARLGIGRTLYYDLIQSAALRTVLSGGCAGSRPTSSSPSSSASRAGPLRNGTGRCGHARGTRARRPSTGTRSTSRTHHSGSQAASAG